MRALRRIAIATVCLLAVIVVVVVAGALVLIYGGSDKAGTVRDEAMLAGRSAESFPAAGEDYFHDMDNAHDLTADEIKGRNMWIVWTGGNDRFWDAITRDTFGTFDLLKTISSHPSLKFSRDNRFRYFGTVNEPCFEKATAPDPARYGLWLDKRRSDCPEDPFANAEKYPGVKIGARGDGTTPVGSYYGEPTGIVGLRLFPNPDFDAEARRKWDPERFYNDPDYYLQKDLVRPYRVGVSCGFCHVGPSPVNPPPDPEHPDWKHLNSTVGAQYFWFDRIYAWKADAANYIFQLVHSYRPGTLDTSLVSTDNIVNPRTMNAVYNLPGRVELARRFGREQLTGAQLDNKQFNDFPNPLGLGDLFQKPHVWTPRILKDASDSVGALGALNRVYLNIGLFSEEWLLHFSPFVGAKRISPIPIEAANRNSSYWRATEQQTYYMAQFLMAAGKPDLLADAPGGENFLTGDQAVLDRGKTVFAEQCARCHSSKLPASLEGLEGAETQGCAGPNYLTCWSRYWAWTKTDEFKQKMTAIVKEPDFLKDNFLSTDFRVPVTLLGTNACSPLATNAIADNIWDNFSSQTYKELPSVGEITFSDPFTGEERTYPMPAGGRGYTRPPSLVGLWSTGPYLLNNTVGDFSPEPSVQARMRVFQSSIEQMLWPENRVRDPVLGEKGVGLIDRTTERSWLQIPAGYLPGYLSYLRTPVNWLLPGAMDDRGNIKIGPIPKGTPVALLGSFGVLPEATDFRSEIKSGWAALGVFRKLRRYMASVPPDATDEQVRELFAPVAQTLYAMSKCPDLVVNRGHYFGTDRGRDEAALSDGDKRALIEFVKTF
jgi:hypothetical protein